MCTMGVLHSICSNCSGRNLHMYQQAAFRIYYRYLATTINRICIPVQRHEQCHEPRRTASILLLPARKTKMSALPDKNSLFPYPIYFETIGGVASTIVASNTASFVRRHQTSKIP